MDYFVSQHMLFQNSRARVLVLAALFFLSLVLLGCGSEETSTPNRTPAASPTTATATATPAPMPTPAVAPEAGLAEIGVRYRHNLYTHCGIRYANFDGRRWLADPILTGIGGVNPPPGWGNPSDPGTMELVTRDRAIFLSSSGEQAFFIPAPEDYQFKLCL